MTVPIFLQTLQAAGIVQPYRVNYKSKTGSLSPIYLIPVYRFPPAADNPLLLELARPIVDTLAQLLKISLNDEIDRTIAVITGWEQIGQEILNRLSQATAIPHIIGIKKGFKAFSEFLEDYVYNKGWGDILEDGDTADIVNAAIDELKDPGEEAHNTLETALTNAAAIVKKLSTKSPTIIQDYKRILLEDYESNYQSDIAPFLEDWIFKYGKIDPTPYERFSTREEPHILFTARDKYFNPTGYYFGLSPEDITEINETRILEAVKIGWLGDLPLPED
jgi:hypothetical protein